MRFDFESGKPSDNSKPSDILSKMLSILGNRTQFWPLIEHINTVYRLEDINHINVIRQLYLTENMLFLPTYYRCLNYSNKNGGGNVLYAIGGGTSPLNDDEIKFVHIGYKVGEYGIQDTNLRIYNFKGENGDRSEIKYRPLDRKSNIDEETINDTPLTQFVNDLNQIWGI